LRRAQQGEPAEFGDGETSRQIEAGQCGKLVAISDHHGTPSDRRSALKRGAQVSCRDGAGCDQKDRSEDSVQKHGAARKCSADFQQEQEQHQEQNNEKPAQDQPAPSLIVAEQDRKSVKAPRLRDEHVENRGDGAQSEIRIDIVDIAAGEEVVGYARGHAREGDRNRINGGNKKPDRVVGKTNRIAARIAPVNSLV
jgi:hypothetical protein